jgi:DNA-binding NarL/FixJ family response regulator
MKILIIDDHAIVREGVRRLLGALPDVEIFEASNAQEAQSAFMAGNPDIVILDINLETSSGLELLRKLKGENRGTRIVMFTMHSEARYAMRALRAGASGYVSKSAPADELVSAVKKVLEGHKYIDREIAHDLVLSPVDVEDPMSSLSNREIEILRLLGEGRSIAEIAQAFGIAYKTVANSCSRLKEKLGIDRTSDLIRFSIENRSR